MNEVNLHKIASRYYEEEFSRSGWLTAKAEYFFHLSFFNPSLKAKEVRYFSDDILNAAEELSEHEKYIEIALSHLQTIYPWKKGYWKYHLMMAYCLIMKDDYVGYQTEFEASVNTNTKSPEVSYYLMIKKLTRARKLNEAENLLNMAQDKYGTNKQLQGLWASYWYSNNSTKKLAITNAIRLARDGIYDLYCTRSIVPILMNEGYKSDALTALNTVLHVWPSNDWANSLKYKISMGIYQTSQDTPELVDNNGEEYELDEE